MGEAIVFAEILVRPERRIVLNASACRRQGRKGVSRRWLPEPVLQPGSMGSTCDPVNGRMPEYQGES